MDLCFPILWGVEYVVFVAVGIATNLVFCDACGNKTQEAIQKTILAVFDEWKLTPQKVCVDSEFVGGDWKKFWDRYDISTVPIPKYSPWPNRAERYVAICKKHIKILAESVQDDPDARLMNMSMICKRAAYARNTQYMKQGRTPIELAFGSVPKERT